MAVDPDADHLGITLDHPPLGREALSHVALSGSRDPHVAVDRHQRSSSPSLDSSLSSLACRTMSAAAKIDFLWPLSLRAATFASATHHSAVSTACSSRSR